MAILTNTELVNFVKKAKDEKWGYVLGGQGELYSKEIGQKFYNMYYDKSLNYYINDCAHWFGHIVADCSGLIISAFRSKLSNYGDRTANNMNSQFVESGKINSIPEILGLAVWHSGHIGVYIGNGKVIEAAGYKVGVVESDLNKPANNGKAWQYWGKLKDIDYIIPENKSFVLTRILKKKVIHMKGADVVELQEALNNLGFACGKVDGDFGDKTDLAVKAFQKSKKLVADGEVGAQTAKALNWIYKG
jgi:hypothetical protein